MTVRIAPMSRYVSVRHERKNARSYLMGTVMIGTAHFDGMVAVGDLVHEATEVLPPSHPAIVSRLVDVSYDADLGRWFTENDDLNKVIDVTDARNLIIYSYGGRMQVVIDRHTLALLR